MFSIIFILCFTVRTVNWLFVSFDQDRVKSKKDNLKICQIQILEHKVPFLKVKKICKCFVVFE